MQTIERGESSIHVDAAPADVYAVVSDVTRTPEYSPEVISCRWLDGASGPAVGARFAAINKVSPRRPTWTNHPVVTVADPPREFAFTRAERFAGTLRWRYVLQPEGTGTRVEESYQVLDPVSRVGWFVIGTLWGRKDRRADLAAGMQQSLERLRAVVEAETAKARRP